MNTPTDAMRVAVLTEPNVIRMEERPVPRPLPDEVLIRVASVGVCGPTPPARWSATRLPPS